MKVAEMAWIFIVTLCRIARLNADMNRSSTLGRAFPHAEKLALPELAKQV
jgi:hypothetical protein